MKPKYSKLIASTLITMTLAGTSALAGVEPAPAPVTMPSNDVVSGTLALDFNTHFISYGFDVWGDGSSLSGLNFNPSIELAFDLPGAWSATLGAWADVTDKGANASIGGKIEEIDIWVGIAYEIGGFTIGATYQNWFYLSETEEILDISISYDTFLSPSLTIHQRLDPGASGGDNGTVLVLGLSHEIEAGPVTISFPFNLAYFVDDGFHGGSDGFGYASLGIAASLPLEFMSGLGDWTLNGGLTYYVTDDGVIPGNRTENFLTANMGLSLSF